MVLGNQQVEQVGAAAGVSYVPKDVRLRHENRWHVIGKSVQNQVMAAGAHRDIDPVDEEFLVVVERLVVVELPLEIRRDVVRTEVQLDTQGGHRRRFKFWRLVALRIVEQRLIGYVLGLGRAGQNPLQNVFQLPVGQGRLP